MMTELTFKAIYDDYLESGLNVRAYCTNQKMNESKFYYWQRQLKTRLSPQRGFIPLVIDQDRSNPRSLQAPARIQPEESPGKKVFCEIAYPNGVRLKLHGVPDLEMVHALVQMAR
jgi:hypothetical protein